MTLSQIHEATAARFKLSPKCMLERTRIRHIAQPRQLAMLIMREAGYSFPRIAQFYGMDHSTVMCGVRSVKERIDSDPAWKGHRLCVLVVLDPLRPAEKVRQTRASPINRKPRKLDSRVAWIPEGRLAEYRSLIRKSKMCAYEAKALILTGAMPPSAPPSAAR